MFLLLATVLAVTVVVSFLWQRYQGFRLRYKLGFDGPPTNLITGNLKELVDIRIFEGEKFNQNVKLYNELIEKYGSDTDGAIGLYQGTELHVHLTDLEQIREVFQKQFSNFTDRPNAPLHLFRDSYLMHSLLGNRGSTWKLSRSVITPTFSTGKLKLMFHALESKVSVLMENMDRHCEKNESFDIYDDLQALTMDVIGQVAFGIQTDSQHDRRDVFYNNAKAVVGQADFILHWWIKMAVLFPELKYVWMAVDKVMSTANHAEKRLTDGLKRVLYERQKTFRDFKTVDIVQLLLARTSENQQDSAKETLPTEELVGNCLAFLLAGYETTSTALSYTAAALINNPDVQQQLQEEIDSVVGRDQAPSYENVMQMKYIDAVFRETLRMYPPVTYLRREALQATRVGHLDIPKGLHLAVSTYAIHHNPEHWPEPERFMPQRFLNGEKHHPMAWIPFGAGPRNCVGLRFAEVEYKLALTALLQKYTLNKGTENMELYIRGVLMRPKNGVSVTLTQRT